MWQSEIPAESSEKLIEKKIFDEYYNDSAFAEFFYYRILCDDVPNLEETNYDELERLSDFNLYYVPFNDLESFLHDALDNGTINIGICKEMLLVLEEYKRFYGSM